MRILYVGTLGPTDTSTHRRNALRRLGHEVIDLDVAPYYARGGSLVSRIRLRTLVGPTIADFNRAVIAAAECHRPDLVWFDKAIYVRGATVAAARALGAYTVQFNIDNPFGPRRDPGSRLFLSALPEYDLHLVQRDVNLDDYRRAGARDVRILRTAYEPSLHFPPPDGWSDAHRPVALSFIGHPYDDRPEFLTALWKRHGLRTRVRGAALWHAALSRTGAAELFSGGYAWGDDYRRAIWESRINLAFLTHSNRDDVAHKAFEIAACGAFLMAEDCPGHRAHFAADEEAVFFTDVDDCAAKIRRYLADEAARNRIAAAGRARAVASGYGNDARLAEVLRYVEQRLKQRAPAPT
ncbi:MAG: glycosyltransferase [Gemmatimonas sp.]